MSSSWQRYPLNRSHSQVALNVYFTNQNKTLRQITCNICFGMFMRQVDAEF